MASLQISLYQNKAAFLSPSFGTNSWYLPVENCVHMFLRLPTQAGLPGGATTKLPSTLTIDVGICTETISVKGTVNNTPSGVSGDPAKPDLENIAKTWWDYGASSSSLPVIKIDDSLSTISAGSFAVGRTYTISYVGSTDFTLIGSSANTIGTVFTATGAGTGTGTATDFQAYIGNVKSMSFTKEGGTEQFWVFEIIFLVRAKI
jgi:hypothetical protein